MKKKMRVKVQPRKGEPGVLTPESRHPLLRATTHEHHRRAAQFAKIPDDTYPEEKMREQLKKG